MTISFIFIIAFGGIAFENKISPNNGIIFNGVLRSKLLNIPLASCFLINHDFLLPHIAYCDNIIVLPLLVLETLGFILSVFFLDLSNKMAMFCS